MQDEQFWHSIEDCEAGIESSVDTLTHNTTLTHAEQYRQFLSLCESAEAYSSSTRQYRKGLAQILRDLRVDPWFRALATARFQPPAPKVNGQREQDIKEIIDYF